MSLEEERAQRGRGRREELEEAEGPSQSLCRGRGPAGLHLRLWPPELGEESSAQGAPSVWDLLQQPQDPVGHPHGAAHRGLGPGASCPGDVVVNASYFPGGPSRCRRGSTEGTCATAGRTLEAPNERAKRALWLRAVCSGRCWAFLPWQRLQLPQEPLPSGFQAGAPSQECPPAGQTAGCCICPVI